jgi:hypothetical protein
MPDFEQLAMIAVRLPDGRASSAWLSPAALAKILSEVASSVATDDPPSPADAVAVMLDGLAQEVERCSPAGVLAY